MGKAFSDRTQKELAIKKKELAIKKIMINWILSKFKNFFKRHCYRNEEASHILRGNVHRIFTYIFTYIYIYVIYDKGLILRIYKIGVKLNEILNSLVKNGQKIQHFTKEDKHKASLSRNVNQNHSEYHYRL